MSDKPALQKTHSAQLATEINYGSKLGICPVCNGNVIEGSENKEESSSHSMVSTGFYCSNCGIKFQFPPPNNIRR